MARGRLECSAELKPTRPSPAVSSQAAWRRMVIESIAALPFVPQNCSLSQYSSTMVLEYHGTYMYYSSTMVPTGDSG